MKHNSIEIYAWMHAITSEMARVMEECEHLSGKLLVVSSYDDSRR